MSEQYDPQGQYDVLDPEGFKLGELRQGRYFEGEDASERGEVKGNVFYYNGKQDGTLEGLTLRRNDPPGPGERLTLCQLVRQA